MVEVKVTEWQIRQGKRLSEISCPIARSLVRDGWENVFVDSDTVSIGKDNDAVVYTVSRRAKKFIRRFDEGKSVKPATFRFFNKTSW